jgi:acyl-CoA thioesterase-1
MDHPHMNQRHSGRGARLPPIVWQVGLLALIFNLLSVMSLMSAATTPAAASDRVVRIVAFGDSLTAGFGLAPNEAFPVQLERALRARGHRVEVINAGVSGDTTAGGLERFDWAVPEGADAAIVELGANDALRGLDPARARANLDQIVQRLKARGMDVLIAGMLAPRNWGDDYARAFDSIFPDLAQQHATLLYPFFLEGVAMRAEFNLGDGIHPTGAGVAEIVRRILPTVEQLIGRVEARRAAHKG